MATTINHLFVYMRQTTSDAGPLSAIKRDDQGYYLFPEDWNESHIQALADEDGVEIGPEQREIVLYIRHYFEENLTVPEARKVLQHLKQIWGEDRATRKYLYKLFPYGFAQQACKYAGMRKPLKLMLDL